jgi:hypothetical protein
MAKASRKTTKKRAKRRKQCKPSRAHTGVIVTLESAIRLMGAGRPNAGLYSEERYPMMPELIRLRPRGWSRLCLSLGIAV